MSQTQIKQKGPTTNSHNTAKKYQEKSWKLYMKQVT